MVLLIILIITEILTILVIRQHFYEQSWMRFYFFFTINLALSIWLWILWFESSSFNGIYDEAGHIWVLLSLNGMICALVFPRIILIGMHYSGVYARRKTGGHKRSRTNAGLIIACVIFLILAFGTFYGRFNLKTDRFTVRIKGLDPDLNGLKIAQMSDLHLTSFYHQKNRLVKAIDRINSENPDIILNTGDFITVGWRETGRNDTILKKAHAKIGRFAVMGNHDFGTYDPYFTPADLDKNVMLMNKFINECGFTVLNNESVRVRIGNATLSMLGVITKGSFPNIVYGDVNKANAGTEGSDLKILMAHDPNQWKKDVTGKTDINITFSGHTHGMQIGILTKKFAWSPAKFFYPQWNGLYREGDQYLVVNRGLGVLAVPFRIWMPPDITIVTLVAE
ncbi:MAG: metallophosphoesterase [Bacteroidales bacterium]